MISMIDFVCFQTLAADLKKKVNSSLSRKKPHTNNFQPDYEEFLDEMIDTFDKVYNVTTPSYLLHVSVH